MPASALAQSIEWVHQFGTLGFDTAFGVDVQGTDVFVSGFTDATFMGETSAGRNDGFVVA